MKWGRAQGRRHGRGRHAVPRGGCRPVPLLRVRKWLAVVAALTATALSATALTGVVLSPRSYAAPPLHVTTSYYEVNANPLRLYDQGKAAGKAGAQGVVILDFGRPADDGVSYGTIGFNDTFISLAAIGGAVENYISAYYRYAPAGTVLDVAIGTNNSCGTGQPCGSVICGCTEEPPNFAVWGSQLALWVEAVGDWAARTRAHFSYTDQVNVIAADDAEPAFDPGYLNTYDLLEGYARTVGGTSPAMVDYGSAEAAYWTDAQLFQVADGFPPDVAMPEVYYPPDAADWAGVLRYAIDKKGKLMSIFGVLAGAGIESPQTAYSDMLQAAADVTHQDAIPWVSTIAPQPLPFTSHPIVTGPDGESP